MRGSKRSTAVKVLCDNFQFGSTDVLTKAPETDSGEKGEDSGP